MIGAGTVFDSADEAWVAQLAVARAHRGRGVAQQLLADAYAAARARGLPARGAEHRHPDRRARPLSAAGHAGALHPEQLRADSREIWTTAADRRFMAELRCGSPPEARFAPTAYAGLSCSVGALCGTMHSPSCYGDVPWPLETRGGGVRACAHTRSWSSSTPTPRSGRSSRRSSSILTVITKGGGTVDNLDIWGRRRLAYEIRKKSEGIYAVINLTAEPADVEGAGPPVHDQRVDHADQGHPPRRPLRRVTRWQAKPPSPWSAT